MNIDTDEDVYSEYFHLPPRISIDYESDYNLIKEFNVKSNFNVIKNNIDGMYSSRLITHDIIRRTSDIIDFDYKETYGDYVHVEPNKRTGGQKDTMLVPSDVVDDIREDEILTKNVTLVSNTRA